MISFTEKGAEKVQEFLVVPERGRPDVRSARGRARWRLLRLPVRAGVRHRARRRHRLRGPRPSHPRRLARACPTCAARSWTTSSRMQGAGFKVDNPNVIAACGCGSSFRVAEEEEVSAGLAAAHAPGAGRVGGACASMTTRPPGTASRSVCCSAAGPGLRRPVDRLRGDGGASGGLMRRLAVALYIARGGRAAGRRRRRAARDDVSVPRRGDAAAAPGHADAVPTPPPGGQGARGRASPSSTRTSSPARRTGRCPSRGTGCATSSARSSPRTSGS